MRKMLQQISQTGFVGGSGLEGRVVLRPDREEILSNAYTRQNSKGEKTKNRVFFFSFLLFIWSSMAMAGIGPDGTSSSPSKYLGAPGSEFNPIEIRTAQQLSDIRNNLSASYILMADIDLNGVNWTPIMVNNNASGASLTSQVIPFSGNFNGNGFRITNLSINNTNLDFAGLFGAVSGTVQNLALENVSISGKDYTGGLVGFLTGLGQISRCYVTGSVQGNNDVGGLVGFVTGDNNTVVQDSYAIVNTSGRSRVAGLIGRVSQTNNPIIRRNYSSGTVTSTETGGERHLVHSAGAAVVENNFSDIEFSGVVTGVTGVEIRTTKQMKSFENYADAGWDFNTVWDIKTTQLAGEISYPYLRSTSQQQIPGYEKLFHAGNGSASHPWQITTAAELDRVRRYLDKQYVLNNDINLNVAPFNQGSGWVPIEEIRPGGTTVIPFSGIFDGQFKKILGLTSNVSGAFRLGLFGTLSGEVKNLGMEGINIIAESLLGGITGQLLSTGKISNCYTSGAIVGSGFSLGGLVGLNGGGAIENSFSDVSITGGSQIGGLIGTSIGGSITNSLARGVQSGTTRGGLVAFRDGVAEPTVINSFWDQDVAANTTSFSFGGGNPTRTPQMKIIETFTSWDFDNIWAIKSGEGTVSYPYLRQFVTETEPGRIKIFDDGDGSAEAPWQISTVAQLHTLRQYLNKNYLLKNDIDLATPSDPIFHTEANGWMPIGRRSFIASSGSASIIPFTGVFDGGGKNILNLSITITTNNQDNNGFFSTINGGQVKNLHVEVATVSVRGTNVGGIVGVLTNGRVENSSVDIKTILNANIGEVVGGLVGLADGSSSIVKSSANITDMLGRRRVGGLVGEFNSTGSITQSFAKGLVRASFSGETNLGGLVGTLIAGSIENSYADVNAYASSGSSPLTNVGGLVGSVGSTATVIKSYASGAVGIRPGTTREHIGGLIGIVDAGATLSENFWDNQTSFENRFKDGDGIPFDLFDRATLDNSDVPGITGKSTEEMQTLTTFTGGNWDISGGSGSYPNLSYMVDDVEGLSTIWYMEPDFAGGLGTAESPYQIATPKQLDNVRKHLVNKYFVLLNDIDMTNYLSVNGPEYNDGKGWDPIGDSEAAFAGVFDGDGHTISGLKVNRPTEDNVGGLFGFVSGTDEVNPAVIKNVGLVDVHVIGRSTVGGLIGKMDEDTSVQGASVTGVVTGGEGYFDIGGLVGVLGSASCKVSDSFADVSVSGDDFVGGLIGFNNGVVERTYSLGSVSGFNAGGLIGLTGTEGSVSFSYWNTETSGITNANGGGEGKTTAEMQNLLTFGGADPSLRIWDIEAVTGVENLYPSLRWSTDLEAGTVWVMPKQVVNTPLTVTYDNFLQEGGTIGEQACASCVLALSDGVLTFDIGDPSQISSGGGIDMNDFPGYRADEVVAEVNLNLIINSSDDLIVAQDIAWSGFDLVLRSQGDIRILAEMTAEGDADKLTLEYGQGAAALNNESQYDFGLTEDGFTGKINLQVGQQFATKLGNDGSAIDWTVIAAPSEMITDLAGNYVLAADIANLGEHTPIGGGRVRRRNNKFGGDFAGTGEVPFSGRYDGLGHTISGLRNRGTNANSVGEGFFGVTRAALIQNIGLLNVDFEIEGGSYVGALVGYAAIDESDLPTKILNAFSTGSVKSLGTTGSSYIGGLIGVVDGGIIQNSFSKASVAGLTNVGGLIGSDDNGWTSTIISNSFATGNVEAYQNYSGGLIGTANFSYITRSYATGDVTATRTTGGLIGFANYDGSVIDSYATGNVSSSIVRDSDDDQYTGGLIGEGYDIEVLRCYATGDVTGAINVGGLIGLAGAELTIKESFASNKVDAKDLQSANQGDSAGGLVGYIYDGAVIENSYSSGEVIAKGSGGSVGGLVGFIRESSTTISDSYTLSKITSDPTLTVGGLVGSIQNSEISTITNSYWNTDLSGLTTSAAGEGKTTAEMQELPTFGGLDASTRIWNIAAADGLESSFPTLRWTTELAGDAIWVMPKKVGKTAVAVSYDNFLQEGGTIGVGKIAGQDCVSCVLSLDNGTLTFDINQAEAGATGIDLNDFPGFREGEVVDGGFDVSLTISSADSLVIDKAFTWDGFKLTFAAAHDIKVNAVVTAAGTSQLDMKSGYNFDPTAPSYDPAYTVRVKLNNNAEAPGFVGKIDFLGRTGTGHLAINGNDYTLIAELGTAADKDAAGNMTLQGLAHQSNMGGYFALSASIDAAATATDAFPQVDDSDFGWAKGFTPIGEDGLQKPFTGGFDGLGQVVSNLFIQRNTDLRDARTCDGCHIGLFGYVEGSSTDRSKIRNIGLTQVAIDGGNLGSNVGALIGMSKFADVSNTFSTGVVSGYSSVGGLFGDVEEGSVDHSFSTSSLSGKDIIGGLIGYADGGSVFSDVFASGNVIGGYFVGGLVGQVSGGFDGQDERVVITRAYATGDVTSTIVGRPNEAEAGGLIGYANYLDLSDSYATGAVSGKRVYVGGLIGSADNTTVTGSNASGSVSGEAEMVGGLIGRADNTTVSSSYATGTVVGEDRLVGGLIGFAEEVEVSDSYTTNAVEGKKGYVGGLIGGIFDGPYNPYSPPTNKRAVIRNSYTTGVVTITIPNDQRAIGGLVGSAYYTDIIGSHATGNIMGDRGTSSRDGTSYVGGLLGEVRYGKVIDSYALGDVQGYGYVGGLIGQAEVMTEISNVYAEGNINARYTEVGGLIGQAEDVAEVKDAHAKGNVFSIDGEVGGLIGETRGITTISRSSAIGSVTSSRAQVGGLVGYANEQTTIHQSFAKGAVRGRASVGGLVGYLNGTSSIHDSFATGGVEGTGKFDDDIGVGGLVGQVSEVATGEIKNTYSLGKVTGNNTNVVGGLIGLIENGVSSTFKLADNYWNMETSGLEVSAGGEGRTNGQMQSFATYHTGESPWNILRVDPFGLENPYPVLRWTTEEEGQTVWLIANNLNDAIMQTIPNQAYTGSAITPELVLTDGSSTLVNGVDYELSFEDNINVGTAKVTISSVEGGKYLGTVFATFEITPIQLTVASQELELSKSYDGTMSALIDSIELEGILAGDEVTVTAVASYDNANAGTGRTITVVYTIAGEDADNYLAPEDLVVTNGVITQAQLTVASQELTTEKVFDSSTTASVSDILLSGVVGDEEVTVSAVATYDNANAGTDKAITVVYTIAGEDAGNYLAPEDVVVETAVITAKTLPEQVFNIQDQVFTGAEITVTLTVKDGDVILEEGVDYEVTYTDNTDAGTATVTVTGIGNYAGTLTSTFEIESKSLEDAEIGEIATQSYTGSPLTPTVTVKDGTVTLEEGKDFTVSYTDNINVGTATVTVTGIGNYAGTLTSTFEIESKSLEDAEIGEIAAQSYTGSPLTPTVTVKDGDVILEEGVDYEVTFTDNTDAGTATVTVTGIGNYAGTLTSTFEIESKSLEDAEIGEITAQSYTGSALTPTVTVKDGEVILEEGVDYEVTYTDNTDAGTATVTVTGIGNYAGTLTSTFEIESKSLEDAEIGEITAQSYTGSALTPTVMVKDGTVTLEEDKDFAVTYSNNTNAGTATVTVTGIGNYAGSITSSFTIDKHQVTVRAADAERNFGEENPVFTFSYEGLLNDDKRVAVEPAISTPATSASLPGTYPIVLIGGSDPNYELTLVNGVLTVIDPYISPVQNLVGQVDDKEVSLSWEVPAESATDILGYRIEVSEDGENYTLLTETEALEYLAADLTNSQKYWFRISAFTAFSVGEEKVIGPLIPIAPVTDDNNTIPTQDPGTYTFTLDGNEEDIFLDIVDDALVFEAGSLKMDLAAARATGDQLPILEGLLVLEPNGIARVNGEGFKQNTAVAVWLIENVEGNAGGRIRVEDTYLQTRMVEVNASWQQTARVMGSQPGKVYFLGYADVDVNGRFTASMDIPGDIKPGRYTLQATGITAADSEMSLNLGAILMLDLDLDTDGDGVPDVYEFMQGTDPNDPNDFLDSNGDGVPD
ncbi:The GLUG motif-containing protein, partial [Belliella buryatensis]